VEKFTLVCLCARTCKPPTRRVIARPGLATNVFALFLSAMLVWAGIVHSVLS
jgi:hypothetical protein